jgi:hypothetical protein
MIAMAHKRTPTMKKVAYFESFILPKPAANGAKVLTIRNKKSHDYGFLTMFFAINIGFF